MTKDNQTISRRTIIVLTVVTAVLVAAVLVALSQMGGTNTGDTAELYSDIPQQRTTLGESDAPVKISLYEDFQCPFCGQLARDTFPQVVEEYVASGEVKVESKPLVFLGEDSLEAARAAMAAGEQDLYWQYHSLLFENQGAENSGYVTDEFLTELAGQIPALDVGAWNDRRAGNSFESVLKETQSEAQSAGVNSTPTMIVSGPEGERKLAGAKGFEEISAAIEEVDGS